MLSRRSKLTALVRSDHRRPRRERPTPHPPLSPVQLLLLPKHFDILFRRPLLHYDPLVRDPLVQRISYRKRPCRIDRRLSTTPQHHAYHTEPDQQQPQHYQSHTAQLFPRSGIQWNTHYSHSQPASQYYSPHEQQGAAYYATTEGTDSEWGTIDKRSM